MRGVEEERRRAQDESWDRLAKAQDESCDRLAEDLKRAVDEAFRPIFWVVGGIVLIALMGRIALALMGVPGGQ